MRGYIKNLTTNDCIIEPIFTKIKMGIDKKYSIANILKLKIKLPFFKSITNCTVDQFSNADGDFLRIS